MTDFLQFALSLPVEFIAGMVLFAVIGAVVLWVTIGPDLIRILIFPAFLVIAFVFYQIAGIEGAVIAVIVGILAVIANPKPKDGYYDPRYSDPRHRE